MSFVINLKRREDRLEIFKNRYTLNSSLEKNITVEYGFDAKFYENEDEEEICLFKTKFENLNPGEIGCFLSHIRLFKKLVESEEPYFIIFEDDALFCDNFHKKFRFFQNLKKFGLIIDLKVKNSLAICNNLNQYLNLPEDIFPWKYNYTTNIHNNKLIKINELQMIKCCNNDTVKTNNETIYSSFEQTTKDNLIKLFVRKIPNNKKYSDRLNYEMEMLENKKLIPHLLQAMQILDLTQNIPHVTRGSCGSSLVCYMLGISHIDPIKNNIKFARFLTNYKY